MMGGFMHWHTLYWDTTTTHGTPGWLLHCATPKTAPPMSHAPLLVASFHHASLASPSW